MNDRPSAGSQKPGGEGEVVEMSQVELLPQAPFPTQDPDES